MVPLGIVRPIRKRQAKEKDGNKITKYLTK